VDIHLDTLEEDFVAILGRRFLERALYLTMCHPASTGFGFVKVRDGKVVGFIVGMLNTSAFYRTLLRTRWHECLLAIAGKCLRGWDDFLQVIRRVRHLFSGSPTETGGKVFTTAIDKAYHGRGLGVELVQAFVDYFRSHGMAYCWARMTKANLAAIRIVTYVGFRFHGELSIGGEPYVVYCLDFDKSGGSE
jgi:ribosomal protein S18 acetylase RimI-like enzyme